MMRCAAGLLALLLNLPVMALAVPLRVCTADQPFYPFTLPDGRGQHQQLLRLAVRELPIELSNYVAPRPRCLQDVRSGQADAAIGVFTAERQAYMAYPMRGADADPRQGLGEVRFVAYRRVGSVVGWDGQRFQNLDGGAIGVLFGFAYGSKLAGLGQPVDDRAISHDQLLQKLERGRNPVVIVQGEQGRQLIAQRFAGKVEPLSPIFDEFTLYLMVAQGFYARHPALVQRLWRAIEATRALPEYKRYQVPPP